MEISPDFLFVNRSPFLHKKSRETNFRSVHAINNRGKSEIVYGMNKVNTNYQFRGFTITEYHGDNEFKPLQYFYDQRIHKNKQKMNKLGTLKNPYEQ